MSARVNCVEISTVMDRIQGKLDLRIPNRLHRIVAAHTGLHPTTVLRYHRCEIEKADARVLEYLLGLEERIDEGQYRFTDEEAVVLYSDTGTGSDPVHVSLYEVQHWFERVLDQLESPGPYVLYRHLGAALDLHPTTVMRYLTGDLPGAPPRMIQVLRDLERRLAAGEVVIFRRGEGEGVAVVPRACITSLFDEMRSMEIMPDPAKIESVLEHMLQLKRGTFRRIRLDGTWPFVRYDLYRKVLDLRDSFLYDPTRHYAVGDRIFHHEFGTGRVVTKYHKSRMLVEFKNGVRRCMCEEVPVDPHRPHPQA